MLVLTRKPAETIHIGDDVVIKVIKTSRGTVKIGIDAPGDIRVLRGELVADGPLEVVPVSVIDPCKGVLSDQYPHVA